MKHTYQYEALPIAPADVETITGLSTTMQRDWRRRELLKRKEIGHFGFTPHEVAEILVLHALRDIAGSNLELAASHATHVAPTVLWFALSHQPAWRFEGTSEEEAGFREYIRQRNLLGLSHLGEIVGAKHSDFVWYSVWHGGKWKTVNEPQRIFDLAEDEEIGGIVL